MLVDLSRVEKIYLRTGYTDMRKQLDGLIDIIQYSFQLDPYSNSLFLFCGKRADRIKAVHYEGDGFCLFYKRYENGRLKWPRTGEEARQISHQQLRWLLEGLNPEQPKAVRKWAPSKPGNSLLLFYGIMNLSEKGKFSAHAGYRAEVQKADQRTGAAGPAPQGAG